MDLTTDELLQFAWNTVEADHVELPDDLGQRVMAGALSSAKLLRHRGWRQANGSQMSSLDAFVKTAAELASLIETLKPEERLVQTQLHDATVHELVVHLVGVERYVLGQLGYRTRLEAPRREDHWPVSRMAATELGSEPGALVAQTWWREVLCVIAACRDLGPEHLLAYHHMTGSTHGLLVLRTFELWTHGEDVRRATHRPLDELDEARLSLMVSELVRMVPLGLALSGCPQPGRTARLELSGAGGGEFDVPLAPDQPAGEANIRLATAAIDLCRLASNRISWRDLDAAVHGELSLLEPLLAGVAAFAAD